MSARRFKHLGLTALLLIGTAGSAAGWCCFPPDPERECILTVDSVSPSPGPQPSPVIIVFEGTDTRSTTYDGGSYGNCLFFCDLDRRSGSGWENVASFWVPDSPDPNECTWGPWRATSDPNYDTRDITYIFPNVTLHPGLNEFRLDLLKQDAFPYCPAEDAEATYYVTYTH